MNIADFAPSHVVLAGDWHTNVDWARDAIATTPQLLPDECPRVILHVGDFGIWPGDPGRRYLSQVSRALADADAILCFVDGNHEDFHQLAGLAAGSPPGEPVMVRKRIWWIPRGYRWTWHGTTWLGLGGGVSVDKAWRKLGIDWWPDEEISDADAAVAATGGPADVMLTHDCPSSVPLVLPTPPNWWRQGDLLRSDLHRQRLQAVVDHVHPKLLVHGHYHYEHDTTVPGDWGPVRVTGLDRDEGTGDNMRVLDTRTLAWTYPKGIAA